MQAEEKDYFKLLAYNLFSYAIDSNSSFKEVYTKKYGITDEQFVNQCKMFLTKINQGNIEDNSVLILIMYLLLFFIHALSVYCQRLISPMITL